MSLSEIEYTQTFKVIESLSSSLDANELRVNTGNALLRLLNADYFCSYIWNEKQRSFANCVAVNMDVINLKKYDDYFWQCDPITKKLQSYRRAVAVNEVMAQKELEKTEFFQDFLRPEGLHTGINLYVYDGDTNIGDFRIWRRQGRSAFSESQMLSLNLIAPHFKNAMINARKYTKNTDISGHLASTYPSITNREADVALLVGAGLSDKEISRKLNVSFATVRSHINQLYNKTGVHKRAAFVSHLQRLAD